MMRNRSVPVDTVLPHITYQDLPGALSWLTTVFGFREHYRYGDVEGPAGGAQLLLGRTCIMVRNARGSEAGAAPAWHTQSLTVFVDNVDAHYETTRVAGANIVEELHETEYGERQYGVMDPEGHHWLFSRHARNVRPEEWGASVSAICAIVPAGHSRR
jgi:uncharacterized glyoxalase superfamily protein PhnB